MDVAEGPAGNRGGHKVTAQHHPRAAPGPLLIGAMAWSKKVDDLRQDPRYTLHSAVTAPDGGEGELKLSGRAVETGHDHHRGPAEAW